MLHAFGLDLFYFCFSYRLYIVLHCILLHCIVFPIDLFTCFYGIYVLFWYISSFVFVDIFFISGISRFEVLGHDC